MRVSLQLHAMKWQECHHAVLHLPYHPGRPREMLLVLQLLANILQLEKVFCTYELG